MAGKTCHWCAAIVLGIGLWAPGAVQAGPYLGDWSWCWKPGRDCPRGEYCALHYWMPELYRVRANVHPSNLDQYPPGPYPPVPATFETTKYPCRTLPPMPTSPYADPAGYYGRAIIAE